MEQLTQHRERSVGRDGLGLVDGGIAQFADQVELGVDAVAGDVLEAGVVGPSREIVLIA